MDKADYINLKKQLSFEKPMWPTLLVILADIGLVALALHLISLGGWGSFVVSQLILAVVYFHNFALLHEAGHGCISRHRWVNDTLGHYFSVMAFLPYYPWKFIHQQHHLYAGNIDKDPAMNEIKNVREAKKVSWIYEFAWKSWLPLAGLRQQISFITYPFRLWKSGDMTLKTFWLSAFSIAMMIATYAFLAVTFPETVTLGNFALSYVFYLVLTELVNFPHHLQMPTFKDSDALHKLHPWQQHVTTRSCDYGVFSAVLALNFNYHIEHHYFPNLPWYRLTQLRRLLKPLLGSEYTELKGIAWNIKNRAISAKDIVLPEPSHPLFEKELRANY